MLLLLIAIVLVAISGLPGLMLGRRTMLGQYAAAALSIAGAAVGIVQTLRGAAAGEAWQMRAPWMLPGAALHVGLDGLSAVFLLPIFLISALGSVYGLAYWRQTDHPANGRKLRLFYGLLTAGMALLVVARNGLLFLYGWELMALAAYFLVTTEDQDAKVRETGWIYLVATHTSTLLLFAALALLRVETGSFELQPLVAGAAPGMTTAIFLLALLGFGIKAGIMPLHVWLPSSHAIAPSHVSALMSGVIIKMGIYGLVRVLGLLPTPPVWPGALLLALGALSGVLGVAFAIGQHDVKRLLAYHSVENIGIIVMGLGVAMLGRALAQPAWVALGLAGCLLHTWNHALFKSLLFFSAGSVIHAAHTRQIDELGGLARAMPRTALGFLLGAWAICGLPPLNGFVSELLVYLGLFRTLGIGQSESLAAAALAAPALAMIGALALACFVKVFGVVFLGQPRSPHALAVRESPPAMTGPLFVLAACCVAIGVAPAAVAPLLEGGIAAWHPAAFPSGPHLAELAPLGWISLLGALLIAVAGAIGLALARRLAASNVPRNCTWGCGYAAPTPRMQYTASSFAELIVGLFARFLHPRAHYTRPKGSFPTRAAFVSHVDDVVLDEAVLPAARRLADWCYRFRWFQQGSVQAYLMYIFVAVAVLMLWHFWQFWSPSAWSWWGWSPT